MIMAIDATATEPTMSPVHPNGMDAKVALSIEFIKNTAPTQPKTPAVAPTTKETKMDRMSKQ